MTEAPPQEDKRLDHDQRLAAFQKKIRNLKERSSLREVTEREMLLEFLRLNHPAISEYPMLESQQNSVVALLCGRSGHPGYEFIQKHIAEFIVLLAHYGKAVKTKDLKRAETLKVDLLNKEAILLKCAQGIVYSMALITDNFEEVVLRNYGQEALGRYSALMEKHELDAKFWAALTEEFIVRPVDEAHKDILEGEKYTLSKERNFIVVRFLFDDILSRLSPTDQTIEKTRIQSGYTESRTSEEGQRKAKITQAVLVKGLKELSQFDKLSATELIQASHIAGIDVVCEDFVKAYDERVERSKEPPRQGLTPEEREELERERINFKFLTAQLVSLGLGAAIAIGVVSDSFFKALAPVVPDQIKGILRHRKDFNLPVLEKILLFMLENRYIQILKEIGYNEGAKIQIRSGRARRVSDSAVDGLPNMSKIRKKQLFGNDTTREDTLLFKARNADQLKKALAMLSLEEDLQAALVNLWKKAVFRVDIMLLVNLELVTRTTTNPAQKISEILEMYGISPQF